MKEKPSELLAEFIDSKSLSDFPEELVSKIKLLILDAIGCGIFGSQTLWGRKVVELAKEESEREEAVLWGNRGHKVSALMAALANGTLIHAFDFDDYHSAKLHPGSVVIPAALAAGERRGISGKELLTAIILGYEVMLRASLAANPNSSRKRGWHLTGTCGTFGAAAAVGKIYGLSTKQLVYALGLAGTQSSGLWAFIADGAMAKRLHPGKAAQSGILAVMLAAKDFSGPGQIFEAEDGGFLQATSDEPNLALLTRNLGEVYHTGDTRIKPYAACGSNHSSIEGVLDLVIKYDLKPEDIEKVVVYNSHVVKLQTGWDYKPTTVLQAQMSLKYCLAAAITDRQILVGQFTEERIKDRELVDLAKRVEVVVDLEIDNIYPRKWPSKIHILLKDGEKLSAYIANPLGSPEKPVPRHVVVEKFQSISGGIIAGDVQDELIKCVENLETAVNVRFNRVVVVLAVRMFQN